MKKTETKKTETKKPTVGTKKPFWDGRLRASTPGYRENYNTFYQGYLLLSQVPHHIQS